MSPKKLTIKQKRHLVPVDEELYGEIELLAKSQDRTIPLQVKHLLKNSILATEGRRESERPIWVPQQLAEEAERAAVRDGISQRQFAIEAIKTYLKIPRQKQLRLENGGTEVET